MANICSISPGGITFWAVRTIRRQCACVEGERMIVGLMRMPAGTGAEPHSIPTSNGFYILEGTFRAKIGDTEGEAKRAQSSYVPSNVVHSGRPRRMAMSYFHLQGTHLTACTASRQRKRGKKDTLRSSSGGNDEKNLFACCSVAARF